MAPDGSHQLVDHFFRHESGRLVAVLVRAFGVGRLELAEDAVQHALSRALQTWGQRGNPENPAGWLYRVARNHLIDQLRRQAMQARYRERQLESEPIVIGDSAANPPDEIADESLRLLFLCCQPAIPFELRVGLALKLVGGFSVSEIAAALLITPANAEKRVYRAMKTLREAGIEITDLTEDILRERLEAVQSTIYLMFNEGYASHSHASLLRRDLCGEAIRLCRMLAEYSPAANVLLLDPKLKNSPGGLARPSTYALLALMLMHLARFEARLGHDGAMILMEDQDRSLWDYGKIREAMDWMAASAQDSQLTRYHIEAAVAWEHCRATSFESVDWRRIVELYQLLDRLNPGPMVRLNLAIATMYTSGNEAALQQLIAIDGKERQRLRPWWDGALATLHLRMGNRTEAAAHFQDALRLTDNPTLKQFFASKLSSIQNQGS